MENGALPFEDRDQLTKRLQLIYDHFKQFGLEMHIGRGAKPSKTEYVLFPPPGFFKRKKILPAMENGVIKAMVEKTRTVRYLHEGKCRQEEREYVSLPKISLVVVSEGFVTLCVHFKYLGSWLSFYLRDDVDARRRIVAANEFMGVLEKFWRDHHVNM